MNSSVPRLARQEDLCGILALYKTLRPTDPELTPDVAAQALTAIIGNPNTEIVVAEAEGQLCSTCMLGIVPSMAQGARPFGVIEHVVTLPDARGKGLGKSVLRFALQLAWEKKCYKVLLLSGEQRKDAHRVYERVGFVGDVEKGFVAKPAEG